MRDIDVEHALLEAYPGAPSESLDRGALAAVLDSVARCVGKKGGSIADRRADALNAPGPFIARATALAGEDLALQVAAELPGGIFGAASYAVATADTVMEAVLVGERYLRELVPGIQFLCRTAGERAQLELSWDAPQIGDFVEELLLALAVRNGRVLLSAAAHPVAVKLRRPRPRDPRPWAEAFGVLPSFGMPRSVVHFMAAALHTPMRTANPALHQLVNMRDGGAFAARVRALLVIACDDASPRSMARELDVPLRTLQRRLRDEGTSFRELCAAVRIDRAKHLLVTTRFPITDIGVLVGFQRPTSFSRAFKVATGLSACEFRSRSRCISARQ